MPKVVFGFRKGERLDYRFVSEQDRPESPFKFPDEYDGRSVKLVISWHGFLVYDIGIDIAAAMAAFMRYVSVEGCCGRCIPGKNGSTALADKLDELRENPTYEALNEAIELGESIKTMSKCSFAPTSADIVVSFLKEYPDRLHRNTKTKKLDYYFHMSAPCTAECPAHVRIPEFIDEIRSRRFLPAISIIRETMPFAGLCGRVCPHPCETVCRRAEIDEPVNIMQLKQSAWNFEYFRHQVPVIPKPNEYSGKNCAVIGAGPAGLTAAYYLALQGHKVDVFEASAEAGGMAFAGIPSFREPKEYLKYEVNLIRNLGVHIHYNRKLGADISLNYLRSTYDATLLAIGAWKAQDSRIEDIENVEGVFDSGIYFLEKIAIGDKFELKGSKVVVIGGGNTAIDCARSCVRLGADVTILYRRTRDEMPAESHEIDAAVLEGVEIIFLAAPIRAVSDNGKLNGIICHTMRLGSSDASGRRSPEVVAGEDFIVKCDYLIPAIGQKSDVDFASLTPELKTTKWNTIDTEPYFYTTSVDGLFAAGDCAKGPDTVVAAVGDGFWAAKMMDRYISSGKVYLEASEVMEKAMYDNKIFKYGEPKEVVPSAPRIEAEKIDINERMTTFEEVERPFEEMSASREAKRCMRCMRLGMFAVAKERQGDDV